MTPRRKTIGLRLNLWLLVTARNWLKIAMTVLAIYISLPWAAPTLARIGLAGPANALYTLYSPFCHQFAFRSIFLYGEQAFYPRAAADTDYKPFEEYAAQSQAFLEQYRYWSNYYYRNRPSPPPSAEDLQEYTVAQQIAARHFIGDETTGYKTALCARDLAIYTMIFVGGLIYWRYRWRIRPLPFWLYVFVGLGPIGLDGFSQLLSYPPFEFWAVRETEPIFRIVTGGLFGLMSAWLGFPYIERSMQDVIERLAIKLWQAEHEV